MMISRWFLWLSTGMTMELDGLRFDVVGVGGMDDWSGVWLDESSLVVVGRDDESVG